MSQQTNSENLLQDVENEMILIPASKGTRFANLLIDTVCFYLVGIVVGLVMGAMALSGNTTIDESDLSSGFGRAILIQYLISFAIYIAYYTLMEVLTKGRTIGKFLTGTKAVSKNGSDLTWKEGIIRSLCRLIPFEAFSILFGEAWHDSLSKTVVIKK